MIPEKVTVTIKTEAGGDLGDYELPAALPVRQFRQALLQALSLSNARLFAGKDADRLTLFAKEEDGRFRIESDSSLASLGIWDGSILTVGFAPANAEDGR